MNPREQHYRLAKSLAMLVCVSVGALFVVTACDSLANFSGPAKGERRVVVEQCDTVNVSYSRTIQPLLQNNCYSCHSNAIQTVGVNLQGYENVKRFADATLLVGVTSRLPGYAEMPPPGPLSDCNKRIIRAWVNQGAKNN
ncbi:MAG: hypothetical protein MUF71_18225 [Candidatus Kapabacteria bacterium]|jgi:cytochrome c5|nr:hypothetical protein [Candidatus Kapabacteria bacterium]